MRFNRYKTILNSSIEDENYENTLNDYFDDLYNLQNIRPSLMIYTDGCSRPHKEPHTGGWAFLAASRHCRKFELDDILAVKYGGDIQTTNNIMEMTAIIESMK